MKRRAGFTLIELVIVVMILGILAGVAAPKLFNTSNTATDNGLKQTLSVVRDAIELYNARYGSLPAVADIKTALAPEFIRTFPKSPLTGLDTVKALAAADDATAWMYSATTGEFICNSTNASAGGSGPDYSTF
jgi:general secretion pathway protein G